MHIHKRLLLLMGAALALSVSISPSLAQDSARPEGWTEESHSKDADLNYDVVFPQDSVNTITLTIAPDEWQAMLDDMTTLYGEFGSRPNMGGGPGNQQDGGPGGQMPPEGAPGQNAPQGGQMPPGGPGDGGGMMGIEENPMWVAVDVEMDGIVWTNVGMRFKGNSSLMGSWGSGSYKMGFKLDFDQFEDTYPEIDNQRFYGFKQLSFSSNWSDSSFLREKVTSDIFREAGLPSAQTAFYAVYVDYGDGPVYFGLYTAVEVVDNTVIQTQFADDSGNVYKPEGEGAAFVDGTFSEDSFDKETNEDEADWSDILALFAALHDETRTTDPATWRANLEAVFDADEFIHWLAVNTIVQNWDTYGQMAHNYYLYNDPTTGQLTWIPWDNNMALGGAGGGNGGPGGDRGFRQPGADMNATTETTNAISLDNVGDNWPLIRYLMDDPVYHALYVDYVEATVNTVFDPTALEATLTAAHAMIAPYVAQETSPYTNLSGQDAFESSVSALVDHVNNRYALAQEYLAASE